MVPLELQCRKCAQMREVIPVGKGEKVKTWKGIVGFMFRKSYDPHPLHLCYWHRKQEELDGKSDSRFNQDRDSGLNTGFISGQRRERRKR